MVDTASGRWPRSVACPERSAPRTRVHDKSGQAWMPAALAGRWGRPGAATGRSATFNHEGQARATPALATIPGCESRSAEGVRKETEPEPPDAHEIAHGTHYDTPG
jgi:hypothetical protein